MQVLNKVEATAYCKHCDSMVSLREVSKEVADLYFYTAPDTDPTFPFSEGSQVIETDIVCASCGYHIFDDRFALEEYAKSGKLRSDEERIEKYNAAINDLRELLDDGSFCNDGAAFDQSHAGSIWLSGEGSTLIDGEYAVYYYDQIHPKMQEFLDKHNMFIEWYDCGTAFVYFN